MNPKISLTTIAAILLAALTACQTSADSPNSKPDQSSLVVNVDTAGHMRAGGYYFVEADVPQIVKQWHSANVTIVGDLGANFADLLHVKSDFESAGVPNVCIAKRND